MAIIRLNKNAFFNNLKIITKKAKSYDKVAIVLKDNAYGHGLQEMAKLSQAFGLKRAVVRNCIEAETIKSYFDYILVLADIPQQWMSHHFVINDLSSICKFPKNSSVELKVDTGMHRNGIAIHSLEEAFHRIKKHNLKLKGVMTHYRSADELSSEQFFQMKQFEEVKIQARLLSKKYGFETLSFHSCNSAGLFRKSTCEEEFARIGIAAYGCLEMPSVYAQPNLEPVLSLYAHKLSNVETPPNARIGYGGTYERTEELLSVYDIGYADGLRRTLSNRYVTPGGEKLRGRVSMDNAVFTGNSEELLVFNNANLVANFLDTIGYEVLVGLNAAITREIS